MGSLAWRYDHRERDYINEVLDSGFTCGTSGSMNTRLEQAFAGRMGRRFAIACANGTVSLHMALWSLGVGYGDEVIVTPLTVISCMNAILYCNAVPVFADVDPETFLIDPEDIRRKITPRTRAVLINSPCNPTGIVLEPERMRALAELGPMIVSDEIYHGLTYGDAEEHSILEYTDNAVVIGGFSKAYAMTGWRLGYLIVPRDLVRPMQALMQNFFLSTNSAVQKAGIAALTCADEDVARMHATYDERRRFLLGELKRLGFNIPVEPMGAFYMLINARHLGSSSMELAFDLLEKAHIGITPGIDFGSQTEGFLRLSYANSIDNLAEAMRRLEAYIRQR